MSTDTTPDLLPFSSIEELGRDLGNLGKTKTYGVLKKLGIRPIKIGRRSVVSAAQRAAIARAVAEGRLA